MYAYQDFIRPDANYEQVIADENMRPEDLLQLPFISAIDEAWGLYIDLFTKIIGVGVSMVTGWYSGSATSTPSPV